MVAITVIFAAVIGAFVLEIGNQHETAPNTSFDTSQSTEYYEVSDYGSDFNSNLTTVEIAHAGGSVVEIGQARIKVDGNASTWGVVKRNEGGIDKASPQPNKLETLGSNEPVEFTSGESWSVVSTEGVNYENVKSPDAYGHDCYDSYCAEWGAGYPEDSEDIVIGLVSDAGYPAPDHSDLKDIKTLGNDNVVDEDAYHSAPLEAGDDVRVVWEASSGGKTNTLFKYTVQ
jgi:hypothetical protein